MQASIKTKSTTIFINNTCISCFFVTPIIVCFFAIFLRCGFHRLPQAWKPFNTDGAPHRCFKCLLLRLPCPQFDFLLLQIYIHRRSRPNAQLLHDGRDGHAILIEGCTCLGLLLNLFCTRLASELHATFLGRLAPCLASLHGARRASCRGSGHGSIPGRSRFS